MTGGCRTFCGNITVDYPFGIEQGCGHPKYRDLVYCINNVMMFHVVSGSYEVVNIDYGFKLLDIFDPKMSTCASMHKSDGFSSKTPELATCSRPPTMPSCFLVAPRPLRSSRASRTSTSHVGTSPGWVATPSTTALHGSDLGRRAKPPDPRPVAGSLIPPLAPSISRAYSATLTPLLTIRLPTRLLTLGNGRMGFSSAFLFLRILTSANPVKPPRASAVTML